MTQFTPSPAPHEVEAFIGQVVTDLGAAFSGVLVNVGRKLGLYQAMADLGPCSSASLAEATGIRERYVREFRGKWLRGGAAPDEPLVGSGDIQSLADRGNSCGNAGSDLAFASNSANT